MQHEAAMWHAMHLPYGLPYAASQTHPEPSKRLLEAAMWRSGTEGRETRPLLLCRADLL
ncbi:MAG: hypothetical protein ACPIOQ_48065 [Promethearchaeia archaeon]